MSRVCLRCGANAGSGAPFYCNNGGVVGPHRWHDFPDEPTEVMPDDVDEFLTVCELADLARERSERPTAAERLDDLFPDKFDNE